MTDTPPLDIAPGPKLEVDVVTLEDYGENVAGFLVTGTADEALARRVLDQHLEREAWDDADFYRERLAAESCMVTAGSWVEVTDVEAGVSGTLNPTGDHTDYLSGESLVTALAGRTVDVSEVVTGVRFLLDVERDS